MKRLWDHCTRYILAMATLLTLAGVACAGGAPAPAAPAWAVGEQPYSTTVTFHKPAATPVPAAASIANQGFSVEDKGERGPAAPTNTDTFTRLDTNGGGSVEALLAKEASERVAPQQRIIVRTVDVTLVVGDLAQSLNSIGSLAVVSGGWMVSTKRDQRHQASISIRVPAEKLDDTVARLRALALKVESEISRSQDVTDEYIDTQARVTNLQGTEAQLLKLLERAVTVEDALKVQAALTNIREQIERNQGRLKLLRETSAFSLINVSLKLGPQAMMVDAGVADTGLLPTAREGEPVRFQASLVPPEDITSFTYRWDFGDGSSPVIGQRVARTGDAPRYTTATVTHVYADRRDSPFIVTFNATGTGDAGVAEGEDTLTVTVARIPPIEVFAGPDLTAREGELVNFAGSFTRPVGLTDFKFKWEFGDGSASVTGSPPEGATGASATHVYPDSRPQGFTATLTVTARSEAGEITGADSVQVRVVEARAWVGGWNPAVTLKDAVRALSTTGSVLVRAGIWLAIFSPFWLAAALVVWKRGGILRKMRRS